MKDSAYEAHSATQAEDCLGQLHRPCSKPEGKHNGNITTQAMGNFPIKELPRQELPLEVAQEYAFAVKNGEFLPDETATSIQFKVTIFWSLAMQNPPVPTTVHNPILKSFAPLTFASQLDENRNLSHDQVREALRNLRGQVILLDMSNKISSLHTVRTLLNWMAWDDWAQSRICSTPTLPTTPPQWAYRSLQYQLHRVCDSRTWDTLRSSGTHALIIGDTYTTVIDQRAKAVQSRLANTARGDPVFRDTK